jgi:AbrB family looped-hinge helix DNA binding protein
MSGILLFVSHMEDFAVIVSKVGRRGQITLPRAIRRRFNLQEGDRVAFVSRGEEIVLQPLTRTLLDLRGSVPVSEPQDFDAIRRQIIREHARKVAAGES